MLMPVVAHLREYTQALALRYPASGGLLGGSPSCLVHNSHGPGFRPGRVANVPASDLPDLALPGAPQGQ
jgi:hypothetical protein